MAKDWFTQAFGRGVADIRQKVVEEGWFGRAVTGREQHHHHDHHMNNESMAQKLGWSLGQEHQVQAAQEAPERDRGIDL